MRRWASAAEEVKTFVLIIFCFVFACVPFDQSQVVRVSLFCVQVGIMAAANGNENFCVVPVLFFSSSFSCVSTL